MQRRCVLTPFLTFAVVFFLFYFTASHAPISFLQKDDVDGEIDLKSCVDVAEFDVEKNYGFQIQVGLQSKSCTLAHPHLNQTSRKIMSG